MSSTVQVASGQLEIQQERSADPSEQTCPIERIFILAKSSATYQRRLCSHQTRVFLSDLPTLSLACNGSAYNPLAPVVSRSL